MAKINDEYDIGAAFEAIENELISSMIRNFENHKQEELDEKKHWSMWQTEMLKSLEKYKHDNQKKYGKQFKDINKQIEALIRLARNEGGMNQEKRILEEIKKGFPAKRISKGGTAEFFKVNDRKLDALIQATTSDMQKAETAVLRMANDQYRKIIYNAQVYANTGPITHFQGNNFGRSIIRIPFLHSRSNRLIHLSARKATLIRVASHYYLLISSPIHQSEAIIFPIHILFILYHSKNHRLSSDSPFSPQN